MVVPGLEGVLGRGADSRLGRALAARGLWATVQTRYAAYAGAGVFAVLAAGPFADGEAVADALAAELRDLAARPPTPTQLRAVRRRQAGALYRHSESNAGLAGTVGAQALFAADPLGAPLHGLVDAPPAEEVQRVASAYLATAPFARATLRASG